MGADAGQVVLGPAEAICGPAAPDFPDAVWNPGEWREWTFQTADETEHVLVLSYAATRDASVALAFDGKRASPKADFLLPATGAPAYCIEASGYGPHDPPWLFWARPVGSEGDALPDRFLLAKGRHTLRLTFSGAPVRLGRSSLWAVSESWGKLAGKVGIYRKGALPPFARVELRTMGGSNRGDDLVSTAAVGSDGLFVLHAPAGVYRIRASAPGASAEINTGATLEVGKRTDFPDGLLILPKAPGELLRGQMVAAAERLFVAPEPEDPMAEPSTMTPTETPAPPQASAGKPPPPVSLSGEWRAGASDPATPYPDRFDPSSWKSVTVPGSMRTWVGEAAEFVWLARAFELGPAWKGRRAIVRFASADYRLDVWVNGRYLGSHEGGQLPFEFDLTPHTRSGAGPAGANRLMVRLACPAEGSGVHPYAKGLIRGIFGDSPGKTDPAQHRGAGLGEVSVRSALWASITACDLRVELSSDGSMGTVRGRLAVKNHLAAPIAAALTVSVAPHNFRSEGRLTRSIAATLAPGVGEITFSETLADPEPWWTHDLGSPRLYAVRLELVEEGAPLDARTSIVGFRRTAVGEDGIVRLNGKPLRLRGASYVSSWQAHDGDASRHDAALRQMKLAHVNSVRVYAHLEGESFYSACDRDGFLVWQDLPLIGGYTSAKGVGEAAERIAEEAALHLAAHPSLLLWCAHAESPPHNAAMDGRLVEILTTFDPGRMVVADDRARARAQMSGWRRGEAGRAGEAALGAWISAYGAQGLPAAADLKRFYNQPWPDWPPDFRKLSRAGLDAFELLRSLKLLRSRDRPTLVSDLRRRDGIGAAGAPASPLPFDASLTGLSWNWAELCRRSQASQGEIVRDAAEALRRARAGAIFLFQWADPGPAVGYGMIDPYGRSKPALDALTQAYAPLLLSLDRATGELWAVNDSGAEVARASWSWKIEGATGGAGAGETALAAGEAKKLAQIPRLSGTARGRFRASLTGERGTLLASTDRTVP